MKTVLCTLYNSLYLDKGLVLYDSLKECCADFVLYVLCMDDKCYEVLSSIDEDNMIPIRLEDFEKDDEELQSAKQNRSFGEYCWTCTPSFILFVIERYNERLCTYIDADMYFYQDPQILIDGMIASGKSVLIVPHRFTKENIECEKNGIFCVEFNTFLNNSEALEVLRTWRGDCLQCCTVDNDGIHFGDQKYLDEWPKKYETVYICSHLGAGVAPWNIQSYKLFNAEGIIQLITKDSKFFCDLIFYHFQHIEYLNDSYVNINAYLSKCNLDDKLVKLLYKDYLRKIEVKKEYLYMNYALDVRIMNHPTLVRKDWDFSSVMKRMKKISFRKVKNYIITKYNLVNDIMRIPN